MCEHVGIQLTKLHVGDPIVATIDGEEYTGEITEINRKKCDLVARFVEDGYISVYLQLQPEIVSEQDLSTQYLVISSTEDAPNDFQPPTASAYDMSEENSVEKLGRVTDLNAEQ